MNSITSIATLGKNNISNTTTIIPDMIQNPNFDTPSLTTGASEYITSSTRVPGWIFNNGVLANRSRTWNIPAPYPNGHQCAIIQTTNSISQNLILTRLNYSLNFRACGRPGYGSNKIFIELLKNNTLFLRIASNLETPNNWTIYTYNFTLTETGSFTLRIRGTNTVETAATAFKDFIFS